MILTMYFTQQVEWPVMVHVAVSKTSSQLLTTIRYKLPQTSGDLATVGLDELTVIRAERFPRAGLVGADLRKIYQRYTS